jgi:hypothetical protein
VTTNCFWQSRLAWKLPQEKSSKIDRKAFEGQISLLKKGEKLEGRRLEAADLLRRVII